MKRSRLWLLLLALVGASGSCGWPWQQSNPNDDRRCDPACMDGQRCQEGQCLQVDAAPDGGQDGDTDAPPPDIPVDAVIDVSSADLDAAASTDAPILDAPAPPLEVSTLDGLSSDADGGAPPPTWAVAAGASDVDRVDRVAIDGAGNLIITGMFNKTIGFTPTTGPAINVTSAGYQDIYVAKLDGKGNFLWAISAGGPVTDYPMGLEVDGAGAIYVTGAFMGLASFGTFSLGAIGLKDIFVMKLDTAGKVLWVAAGGSTGWDVGRGVAVDSAGDVYLGAAAEGPAAFGSHAPTTHHGKRDVILAKLDKTGKFLWVKSAGGAGYDELIDLELSPAGTLTAVGGFTDKASFGTLAATAAGASTDIFVARIGAGGAYDWVSTAGGAGWDRANRVAVDSAGNSYAVGAFVGTAAVGTLPALTSKGAADVFVARLDAKGAFTWARRAGGTLADNGVSVVIDPAGSVHVVGVFSGIGKADFGALSLTSNGGEDIFAARLTPGGVFDRVIGAGGTGPDNGAGVAAIAPDDVVIGGSFTNTVSFGGKSFTSKGNHDAFIWRLGYP